MFPSTDFHGVSFRKTGDPAWAPSLQSVLPQQQIAEHVGLRQEDIGQVSRETRYHRQRCGLRSR